MINHLNILNPTYLLFVVKEQKIIKDVTVYLSFLILRGEGLQYSPSNYERYWASSLKLTNSLHTIHPIKERIVYNKERLSYKKEIYQCSCLKVKSNYYRANLIDLKSFYRVCMYIYICTYFFIKKLWFNFLFSKVRFSLKRQE